MCASRKQVLTVLTAIAAASLTAGAAFAGETTSGAIALGESHGGVTDRAYVASPPNWSYVVEREPGSFLDCGAGMDMRSTDESGRDLAALTCGVTLTETVVIPAAAQSARIIIHN